MTEKQMKIKQKSKKNIKKSFYEVRAPLTATGINLYANSQEELIGKIIRLDLTKSLRGKSLELKLRIKSEKGSLIAKPESIELTGSYIRRAIRKGVDYCEDSFKTECRDFLVVVKPFMLTRKKVSRAVLKTLRENAKKFISSHIKTITSEEIFSEIISNKLQKNLAQKLKKIYPLAMCEIRIFQILKPLEKSAEIKEKRKEIVIAQQSKQ